MKRTACAVLLLVCLVNAGSAACTGESPAAVLDHYTTAYEERNASGLEALYAEDYVWIPVTPPRAEIVDRATTLKAAKKMLEDPRIESASLALGGEYLVVPGDEPGTWRIENVMATLDVTLSADSEHGSTGKAVTACETFYVREVGEDPVMYEIYREVSFEGLGCGGTD